MKAELSIHRVNGFLDVDGRRIINQAGEEIILAGWGLGNWLLCEGYMWRSNGADRFDRPRRIELGVEELCGKAYAATFWPRFLENYITEDDIKLMAKMGYNSVRIPINARLFLEEGPGLKWVDTGFEWLDKCIDWCEKHRIYAFIDLHGAPGGQTGANIDDCIDDVPRLFVDQACYDKGIALWEKLAQRYKDRWIVGGYDLLNEPIRPVRFEGDTDLLYLLPRLKAFYKDTIAAIRRIDQKHLITLEGHYWASTTDIFDEVYDDKMVLHFHRYGVLPDISAYQEFIDAAKRLNCPLWLGETGESVPEWFAAMYPLAAELHIGYNLWPWKKMNCLNSPCSVIQPEGWDKLIAYFHGGAHPGYVAAQKLMDKYLENMLLRNCDINADLTAHVFRTPGCTLRGTDFDEIGGNGVSYQCSREIVSPPAYRRSTGMEIVEKFPDYRQDYGFECLFKRYVLALEEKEFACYTFYDLTAQSRIEIACYSAALSTLLIYQDEELLGRFTLGGLLDAQYIGSLRMNTAAKSVIRLEVEAGRVEVEAVITASSKDVNL